MLPRKAVPVLSLRNARAKSVVSIEHKTTTIHRTTTGSKYKMQWSKATFRIQTYSKRVLLNTPRIQDSRFWVRGESFALEDKERNIRFTGTFPSINPRPFCSSRTHPFPKAEIEKTGVGTWGGYHIYICVCVFLFIYLYIYNLTYLVH